MSEVENWLNSQSDTEEKEMQELEAQREREEMVAEITIRRVEMLLLQKLGVKHIEFIRDIGLQVRSEFGLEL